VEGIHLASFGVLPPVFAGKVGVRVPGDCWDSF